MTDHELLEAAAKAAGYDFVIGYWNPLTDDGDALRLAVKLGITVYQNLAEAGWDDDEGNPRTVWEGGDDQYAATRRVIVRAAAEIGRAK